MNQEVKAKDLQGFPVSIVNRLVKYSHLNHHGTLFAGQGAEWFVESGFIAAASLTAPENIVCVKVHGMVFRKPVQKGTIVFCKSQVVLAGKTRLVAYVNFSDSQTGDHIVDGFLSFVHVDLKGVPVPHHIQITPSNEEEELLQKRALALKNEA